MPDVSDLAAPFGTCVRWNGRSVWTADSEVNPIMANLQMQQIQKARSQWVGQVPECWLVGSHQAYQGGVEGPDINKDPSPSPFWVLVGCIH